ncbi:hypothetical protein [Moorena sp. SIO3I6]|uniref:hypothetical protein n=1 Tax=Moorena sp. SIO3I6 TaxID=2607831 RepID=UPI0025CFE941|nr:hypothetical protein [Moorena sp. SIO3I6]
MDRFLITHTLHPTPYTPHLTSLLKTYPCELLPAPCSLLPNLTTMEFQSIPAYDQWFSH